MNQNLLSSHLGARSVSVHKRGDEVARLLRGGVTNNLGVRGEIFRCLPTLF